MLRNDDDVEFFHSHIQSPQRASVSVANLGHFVVTLICSMVGIGVMIVPYSFYIINNSFLLTYSQSTTPSNISSGWSYYGIIDKRNTSKDNRFYDILPCTISITLLLSSALLQLYSILGVITMSVMIYKIRNVSVTLLGSENGEGNVIDDIRERERSEVTNQTPYTNYVNSTRIINKEKMKDGNSAACNCSGRSVSSFRELLVLLLHKPVTHVTKTRVSSCYLFPTTSDSTSRPHEHASSSNVNSSAHITCPQFTSRSCWQSRFLDISTGISAWGSLIVFYQFAVLQVQSILLSICCPSEGDNVHSISFWSYPVSLLICVFIFGTASFSRSYHSLRFMSWSGAVMGVYLVIVCFTNLMMMKTQSEGYGKVSPYIKASCTSLQRSITQAVDDMTMGKSDKFLSYLSLQSVFHPQPREHNNSKHYQVTGMDRHALLALTKAYYLKYEDVSWDLMAITSPENKNSKGILLSLTAPLWQILFTVFGIFVSLFSCQYMLPMTIYAFRKLQSKEGIYKRERKDEVDQASVAIINQRIATYPIDCRETNHTREEYQTYHKEDVKVKNSFRKAAVVAVVIAFMCYALVGLMGIHIMTEVRKGCQMRVNMAQQMLNNVSCQIESMYPASSDISNTKDTKETVQSHDTTELNNQELLIPDLSLQFINEDWKACINGDFVICLKLYKDLVLRDVRHPHSSPYFPLVENPKGNSHVWLSTLTIFEGSSYAGVVDESTICNKGSLTTNIPKEEIVIDQFCKKGTSTNTTNIFSKSDKQRFRNTQTTNASKTILKIYSVVLYPFISTPSQLSAVPSGHNDDNNINFETVGNALLWGLRVSLIFHILGAFPIYAVTARKAFISGVWAENEDDDVTVMTTSSTASTKWRRLLRELSVILGLHRNPAPYRHILLSSGLVISSAGLSFIGPTYISLFFSLNGDIFGNLCGIGIPVICYYLYLRDGRGNNSTGYVSQPESAEEQNKRNVECGENGTVHHNREELRVDIYEENNTNVEMAHLLYLSSEPKLVTPKFNFKCLHRRFFCLYFQLILSFFIGIMSLVLMVFGVICWSLQFSSRIRPS
eukprot:Tbor_TRINITY_DN1144_c0_g1::TRINITY_DN1144_c0_g1_i1::g.15626::m.15626